MILAVAADDWKMGKFETDAGDDPGKYVRKGGVYGVARGLCDGVQEVCPIFRL